MAETRKGVARQGSSELWRRGFARISNIDAEGLRMETEITRDRYFQANRIGVRLTANRFHFPAFTHAVPSS